MQKRHTATLAILALGALGLSACGSTSSSSAPTTTGASVSTTTATMTPGAGVSTTTTAHGSPTTSAGGTAPSGLCADIATFSKQEQGLVTAEQSAGSSSASLSALQSYAKQSKADFDKVAPKITADLSSAPTIVQKAWASLQPQVDQLFQAAATATSMDGFTRAAASVESTNGFSSANATLSTFAKGACPATSGG